MWQSVAVAEDAAAGRVHQGRTASRCAGLHAQLQQRQLALQVVVAGHVVDGHHVDQLVQLVDDLLDHRRPSPW